MKKAALLTVTVTESRACGFAANSNKLGNPECMCQSVVSYKHFGFTVSWSEKGKSYR